MRSSSTALNATQNFESSRIDIIQYGGNVRYVIIIRRRRFDLHRPLQIEVVGVQASESAATKRKRGIFQKDLQHMMYGYGDDSNPLPETVALMEDIVIDYVTDMVHKAQDVASKRGKLLTEDFLFLLRKDMPKLNRCTELLAMNEELKRARKAFEVDAEKLANED